MSVWKDVDGILNADPKIFPDARKIDRLNYTDTIEMAYSGAQIIHPKTIKPLEAKRIPLYVRPFGNKHAAGSVITADVERIKALGELPYSDVCVLVTNSWREISEFLRTTERAATVVRKTKETDIEISVDLDGKGTSGIDTGLKFLDHMIDQIVHHAGVSLTVKAKGDLQVDEHHTMEDVAIVLGEAIIKALGNKRGIGRYGFVLPMDECKALVLIDFGGRIDFEWDVEFTKDYVGDVPTEMFKHFFKSLGAAMSCNLHIAAKGENNHHLAEGIFKGFARALRMAIKREVFSYELPSSKGVL
jgi:imidazoleglycerol-phosphate dehydratase/histidinol-phosphatase